MNRIAAISCLKRHEAELRGLGVASLSLFGSTARGDAQSSSDVDLAATFDETARVGLFRFATISDRLGSMLGKKVDLVGEPARKARFQAEIDRDRVRVF